MECNDVFLNTADNHNWSNESYRTIGNSTIARRHQSCVLAPNGKIYFAPSVFSSHGVLDVNPDDDSFISLEVFLAMPNKVVLVAS